MRSAARSGILYLLGTVSKGGCISGGGTTRAALSSAASTDMEVRQHLDSIDNIINIGMHVLDGQVSSCTYGGLPDVAIGSRLSVIKEDGSHGVFVDAAQSICMLLPLYALHGCPSCLQKVAVKIRIIVLEGIFWRRLLQADVCSLYMLQDVERMAQVLNRQPAA